MKSIKYIHTREKLISQSELQGRIEQRVAAADWRMGTKSDHMNIVCNACRQHWGSCYPKTMCQNWDLPSYNVENPAHVLVSRRARSCDCLRAALWELQCAFWFFLSAVERNYCVTVWLNHRWLLHPLCPKPKCWSKQPNKAFISCSYKSTRASQKGPQTPPSLLQETGNTFSHLGANHKPQSIRQAVFGA